VKSNPSLDEMQPMGGVRCFAGEEEFGYQADKRTNIQIHNVSPLVFIQEQ
jgi:hypothetical protein